VNDEQLFHNIVISKLSYYLSNL